MGVKKSTVCTRAWSGAILYTPASSAWSKPTRTFGSCCRANFPSTVSSAAGLSLDAQPAAFTDSVNRIGFTSGMKGILLEQIEARNLSGWKKNPNMWKFNPVPVRDWKKYSQAKMKSQFETPCNAQHK